MAGKPGQKVCAPGKGIFAGRWRERPGWRFKSAAVKRRGDRNEPGDIFVLPDGRVLYGENPVTCEPVPGDHFDGVSLRGMASYAPALDLPARPPRPVDPDTPKPPV